MQHCGDAFAAFEIARINGISPTEILEPGTKLEVPEAYQKAIAAFMQREDIKPATAEENQNNILVQEGIGYWTIGQDFIVQ